MSLPETKRIEVLDAATHALDRLADMVDALIAAWETGTEPPDLAQFVPEEPKKLRPMFLSELIKVDLEFRWHGRRAPKKVEEYIAEFPELASGGIVPCDLIYEEFHVRKQSGDLPKPEDFYERFAGQTAQLKKLLGMEEAHLTTTMVGGGGKRKELKVGEKIDDFELLTELGKGAFAQVYLARQVSMQRLVALKVSADKGSEGATLALFDHPNIVRVYDQRVLPEKRLRLMYMQNIAGGTLQGVVARVKQTPVGERTGKMLLDTIDESLMKQGMDSPSDSSLRRRLANASWPEVVCYLGARMAAGLDHAHQSGVLHRDIKPANVLMAADGTPKLADFNVSFNSKLEGATPAAYFGGSLAYMSPEQLEAADPDNDRKADDLDGRSDVFALGIVLWELLTGQRPFSDQVVPNDWAATLKKLIASRRAGVPAEALKQFPEDLPTGLDAAILDCLHADAADRPATAGVLSRQLDLCLKSRVQQLLRPKTNRVRTFVKQHPLATFICMSVIANIIMCFFNLIYNQQQIVRYLNEDAQRLFKIAVLTINGVCYTIGISAGVWLIRPVMLALRELRDSRKLPQNNLPALRHRSANLGDIVTWITLGLWLPSGIAFPLWLYLGVGDASGLQWGHFAHFGASNLVCGLMAATHTFFLCTFVAIRYYYPRFVQPEGITQSDDLESLAKLEIRSGRFLNAAFVAPVLAALLYISLPSAEKDNPGPPPQTAQAQPLSKSEETVSSTAKDSAKPPESLLPSPKALIILLVLFGILGALLASRLNHMIQSDIAALATALDPTHEGAAGTETFEASWTVTR